MIEGDIIRGIIAFCGVLLILYGEGLKRYLNSFRRSDIQGDIATALVKRQYKFKRCNKYIFFGSLCIGLAIVSWFLV